MKKHSKTLITLFMAMLLSGILSLAGIVQSFAEDVGAGYYIDAGDVCVEPAIGYEQNDRI